MQKVEGQIAKVLKEKLTVVTRAIFWKIPHDSKRDDIRLKLGRYKKPANYHSREEPESVEPKSELTLDEEESKKLIEFLQENYEPFRQGFKAFIPLDRPFNSENAGAIRGLFSRPETDKLVAFILDNNVIPPELVGGLRQAMRARAVAKFRSMLAEDLPEGEWQRWFENNDWVLGSQFVRVLDQRSIDTQNISDFLMEAYDGFLDVVEIKRPGGGLRFWASALDHGNYIPSTDLTKAVTQAAQYIYEIEREANSVKFLQRVGGVRTVKPRCVLIFGRSDGWDEKQTEAYRIMNASYQNISVLTYDHVLTRAERVVGIGKRIA